MALLNHSNFDANKNILLSYHYHKKENIAELMSRLFTGPYPRIILDSGAWSAFSQGVDVSLDDYIKFIYAHKDALWWYSNLDDMTDHRRTMANQREMERQGLTPVPVFHTGEPWSVLEQYAEQYPYMALGKIIPFRSKPKIIIPWLSRCFSIAKPYGTQYHGFGVSTVDLLKLFPWATADSSTWSAGFRFGRVSLFDPRKAAFVIAQASDPSQYARYRALFDEHGYRHFRLYEVDGGSAHKEIGGLCSVGYLKMNSWMRRAKKNEFAYFFACSNEPDAKKVSLGMEYYLGITGGVL